MNRLRRLLVVIWLVLVFAFGAWLMFENSTQVIVTLMGFKLPSASVGLVITLTLLIGLLVGLMSSFIAVEPRLILAKRELQRAKKELGKLRSLALKE